jgi:hypothetical protein
MTEMLLGNVEEAISDEEIGEFLAKYGFPPFSSIQRIAGAGSRPAALLTYNDITADSLRTLQPRIHNMYWKDHTITALIIPHREES